MAESNLQFVLKNKSSFFRSIKKKLIAEVVRKYDAYIWYCVALTRWRMVATEESVGLSLFDFELSKFLPVAAWIVYGFRWKLRHFTFPNFADIH